MNTVIDCEQSSYFYFVVTFKSNYKNDGLSPITVSMSNIEETSLERNYRSSQDLQLNNKRSGRMCRTTVEFASLGKK